MSIFRKFKKKKADLEKVTTMELSEFVRHTLAHIVTGVKKAQEDVKRHRRKDKSNRCSLERRRS